MPENGVASLPATVEEAAALLERVARDRSEYLHPSHDNMDVGLSVDMLRAAANIIRTGDVRAWVPSWKWQQYRSQPAPTPELAVNLEARRPGEVAIGVHGDHPGFAWVSASDARDFAWSILRHALIAEDRLPIPGEPT